MAKDGTWGDHVVLFAAANHFQTAIRIISSLDREIVVHPEQAVADPTPLCWDTFMSYTMLAFSPERYNTSLFPVAISQVCLTGGKCAADISPALRCRFCVQEKGELVTVIENAFFYRLTDGSPTSVNITVRIRYPLF